ncbi:Phage-related minor tail protein [Caulifigura coniformis]|uniref:Phage-related minor tail protein n=1 Tax=Caulifigura coniformis TaxID=2527983 RepID=A0A517SBT6_9PLAN|nr:phage tail tape measure protein [Caulifigura coniformis]QDT53597.1 Phage-related minor tail protein [Caulifigura coniformis]
MSEEIKQVLGFDVADGISNLEKFGQSLSNVSGRLTRFGTALDKFNARFSGTPASFNATTAAADRMEQSVSRLTTSTALLARIVYTQLVIKGLRLTEQAMVDAAGRAAELQIELAKVSTVAGDTFSGIGDIGSSVADQSKALGIDQLEVASGLYQALQNQIGGTKAELLDFNRVASQFAIGTVTQQNTAVELLSGTLNAYGLDVSRAEELASKFNKTIEVGNIEGAQLATVFGRVSTRGADLGVTFEELNGLLATLTIRGVKASEAATQVSGLLSAFTKPSDAMKRALEQLNVPSGEFLIRSVGLADALKQVASTTDGSSTALAQLFPNVRALNGVSVAASDNLELLNKNIAAIRDTSSDLNKQRFEIIASTDAKRVAKELNEIKIATTEVGEALLHTTAEGLKFVGGAENIIATAKNAAPAIAAVTAATAAYVATTRLAVVQGTALAGVLTNLSKVGLGIGAALSLGNFIGDALDDSRFEAVDKLTKANEQFVEKFVQGERIRLAASRQTFDTLVKLIQDASREQVRAFDAANDEIMAGEKRLISVATDSLHRFIGTRESLVRELEQAAKQSADAVEQSQQRVRNLTQSKSDRKFDESLRDAGDAEKISRNLSKVVTDARKAATALGSAQTDQQIQEALRLFDSAERRAEQARSLAESSGNRGAENTALATINKLTNQRINAEKSLQSLQTARLNTLNAETAKQQQLTDSVKASAKELLDNLPTVGLDPQEQAKRAAAREAAMQNILKAGFSKSDINLTDALGLAKLAQDMERNPLPISFNVEGAVNELTTTVQKNLDNYKFNVKFDVAGLENALGTTFKSPDEASAGLAKAVAEADKLRTSMSQVEQDRTKAITGVKDEVRALLDSTGGFANWLSRSLTVDQPTAQKALGLIDEFRTKSEALLQSTNVTKGDVQDLFKSVEALAQLENGLGGSIFGSGGGLSPDIEALSRVTERILQIADMPTVDPGQVARLQQLEAAIQGTNNAATNIENALKRGADYAATRLEQAVARLPVNKTLGGLSYHAQGGAARGTDTIPAMLTPGEFVVNQRASRRFFSDLQRMNAGMEPTYRNDGGVVNNTMGDVSIQVDGSKAPHQTAEAIARSLKRAMRKGTISPF